MATEAQMLAKIPVVGLDPLSVTLTVTRQYDSEVWVLSGNAVQVMPDGTNRFLYEVNIVEPKT